MLLHHKRLKTTYLISGLVICLVSILLASATSYAVSRDITARQSNERMRQMAMKRASELDSWFVRYSCVVEGLAEDMEALGLRDKKAIEPLVRYKFDTYAPEVLDFYVGLEDGTLSSGIGWRPDRGYDCRTREWYRRALTSRGIVFTEPYIDAQTGKMVITISRRLDVHERATGVVAADIVLTKVIDVVDRNDMQGSRFSFLLNGSGDILAHPDQGLLPTASGMKNVSSLGRRDYSALGAALKDSRLGLVEAKDDAGRASYFMLSRIDSCGWFFGVSIDPSEYKRPLDSLLYGFLAALLVSALAGVLVMQKLMGGMLEPIRSLNEAVKSFSATSMDARVAVDSEDELGELGRSFNGMADTIQEYSRSLELKVEERTRALQEKNDKITESISYAERIQRASLPDLSSGLSPSEGEAFAIWKPRDVVGGDFYWCRREGGLLLLVLADCTGHGVPGALMTMSLESALDGAPTEIVSRGPSALVRYAHERLREMLGQGRPGCLADDGADLAICAIDREAERVVYCGARMPLFVESGGKTTVHRGGPSSVGYSRSRAPSFEDEDVEAEPGSVFYLTTDGLLDQDDEFGKGGMGRTGFADFAASQAGLSMREREAGLSRVIERRLAGREQRDDIAVLCFSLR
jgi:Serine phosphatase RsbU, regulator of sigma subunit